MTRMGHKKMTNITIGIDISKAFLDVATYPLEENGQFSNDEKGYKSLLQWMNKFDFKLIVFEPTGAYHRGLETFLSLHPLTYAKINPLHAKRFGETIGKLVKTDKADAQMLAHYGAILNPEPTKGKSQDLVKLHELVVARRALMKDKTAALNRLDIQEMILLKRQLTKRLKQIEADIVAIDQACQTLIKSDTHLNNNFIILKSIPGLGDITEL